MNGKILVGIGRILIALVFTPLHAIMIWLFLTKKEYRTHTSFHIMASLGIVDCLHLVANFVTGLMTIFYTNMNIIIERVTGALLMSCWVGMGCMIIILALNRMVVLMSVKFATMNEKTIFNGLLGLSWILVAANTGLHLTDDGAVDFSLFAASFTYRNTLFNNNLGNCESHSILLLLLLSLICYVGIVLWILLNKSFKTTYVKIERHELRILMQAIIIFTYMAALRCLWQFGAPIYLKYFFVIDILNIVNCLIGAVNPVIYLVFNGSIRGHFVQMLQLQKVMTIKKKKVKVTVISVQSLS
ncbi:hypothetical protein QR680_015832 [Steinernema hermaphroditum]|uniref:G-protein coupled receptors family 1 profile domain-containing protein n=1 Tax=Steinernema hermaphroditum TaxID=289476 RepID=A0AA39HBN1_9BILA|nr:hypothetical protein QR680_015832 [Steinernema hermaphroditum]